MPVRSILLLGDPVLHEPSSRVRESDLKALRSVVNDLHDTLLDFQRRTGVGRAIAAPQIGVRKRLVYMHIDSPVVFINPEFELLSEDMIELWDDCMCFPDLLVRVSRHHACRIRYRDLDWSEHRQELEGDLSELLQHEVDHLDGILATQRAVDGRSFALRVAGRALQRQTQSVAKQ